MRDDDDLSEVREEDEKLKSFVIDKVIILILTNDISIFSSSVQVN